MSKKKLLIREVFEKIKRESPKDTKSGWADDLSDDLEKRIKFVISGKTLSRYYDSFVAETRKETGIETIILDKLSQYIGYENFKDFSQTFEKKIESEGESTTSMKFILDGEEVSVPEKIFNIIIKITNNPNFNVPDFMKKNGLGVLEFAFVALLVTGGVFFSNPVERNKRGGAFGLISPMLTTEKSYMYWNGERYMATDSSSLGSQIEVVPMNEFSFKNLKKITRADTLNVENSMGKVWYDKSNNHVEFFTSFGKHPENEKALKDVTEYVLETYAGANAELEN